MHPAGPATRIAFRWCMAAQPAAATLGAVETTLRMASAAACMRSVLHINAITGCRSLQVHTAGLMLILTRCCKQKIACWIRILCPCWPPRARYNRLFGVCQRFSGDLFAAQNRRRCSSTCNSELLPTLRM